MALQTREQHIRRERATSNICTAQALLANTSVLYAMYHGPSGLRNIAQRVHDLANMLSCEIEAMGLRNLNDVFFDTLCIDTQHRANAVLQIARAQYFLFCTSIMPCGN